MTSFSNIINQNKPVLVDFFADWCGPCKMMSPILKDVKDSFGEAIAIIKIDIDKNQQAALNFNVRSVPTFILFKNGQQLWRQSGMLEKNELASLLKFHI